MTALEQTGLAYVVAQEGNAQIARGIAAGLKDWFAGISKWLEDMPTTMPPTEASRH